MLPTALPDIIQQHADGSAIATMRRPSVLEAYGATMADLAVLDQEIASHLEGLRLAGRIGWEHAIALFEKRPTSGTIVAIAYLAAVENVEARMKTLAAYLSKNTDFADDAAFGLAFHGFQICNALVSSLIAESDAALQATGFALALLIGRYVDAEINAGLQGNTDVARRAVMLAGWVSARSTVDCGPNADPEAPEIKASLAIANALLSPSCATEPELLETASGTSELAATALALVALKTGHEELAALVARNEATATDPYLMITAAGLSGQTAFVPWLLQRVADEPEAEAAHVALRRIVGVDIDKLINAKPPIPQQDPFEPQTETKAQSLEEWLMSWWHQAETRLNCNPLLFGRPRRIDAISPIRVNVPLADRPLMMIVERMFFGQPLAAHWTAPVMLQMRMAHKSD